MGGSTNLSCVTDCMHLYSMILSILCRLHCIYALHLLQIRFPPSQITAKTYTNSVHRRTSWEEKLNVLGVWQAGRGMEEEMSPEPIGIWIPLNYESALQRLVEWYKGVICICRVVTASYECQDTACLAKYICTRTLVMWVVRVSMTWKPYHTRWQRVLPS